MEQIEWIRIEKPIDYAEMLTIMERKVAEVINGGREAIYLVEHLDCYTGGTGANPEDVLDANIKIYQTGRGGKYTYHGLGQRVIYPILNLNQRGRDLKAYVRNLERWVINILAHYGLECFAEPERIGIWTKIAGHEQKIAAIGIRVKKWVTFHGVAVNINTDLNKYGAIIPCGISNFGVTSLQDLGIKTDFAEFDQYAKQEFMKLDLASQDNTTDKQLV